MFFELIAAFVAGFLAAGVVMILNLILGRRLPKWLMPVAAGAAMIAFGSYLEYTWFDRTASEFPPSVEIVSTSEVRQAWRPWTYLWPITNRMTVIDRDSIRSNAAAPDQRMAEVVFLGRWKASSIAPVIFDCAGDRVAPLVDTVNFDEDGRVTEADWRPAGDDAPALTMVCKEE